MAPEEIRFCTVLAVRLALAEAGNKAAAEPWLADSTAMLNMICLQYGGEDLRTVGEVCLYAFPRADDATHAACDMQSEMACQEELTGHRSELRIGLDSGDIEYSGGTWLGQPLLRSTRLSSLAPPGAILVAATLRSYLSRETRLGLLPFTTAEANVQRLGTQAYELPWGEAPEPEAGGEPPKTAMGEEMGTSTLPLGETSQIFSPAAIDVTTTRIRLPLPPGMTEHSNARPQPEIRPTRPTEPRLCLIRGRRLIVVDARSPHATFGRGAENDIQIDIETASRRHAEIAYSGGRFVLTDHSWNGTYVYDAQGSGQLVHNDHLELPEEGYVCPGTPKVDEITSFRFRRADAAPTATF